MLGGFFWKKLLETSGNAQIVELFKNIVWNFQVWGFLATVIGVALCFISLAVSLAYADTEVAKLEVKNTREKAKKISFILLFVWIFLGFGLDILMPLIWNFKTS